ncbi:MAG TPA: hypothetical protein VNT22_04755 [Baekduia sp.]|nr:hypothetical protein [Baekduia sp.]
MQHNDPYPSAQAILRTIENEARERRKRSADERMHDDELPVVLHGPGSQGESAEPGLDDSLERLTALVDHVATQTDRIRDQLSELSSALDALADGHAAPAPPRRPRDSEPD